MGDHVAKGKMGARKRTVRLLRLHGLIECPLCGAGFRVSGTAGRKETACILDVVSASFVSELVKDEPRALAESSVVEAATSARTSIGDTTALRVEHDIASLSDARKENDDETQTQFPF